MTNGETLAVGASSDSEPGRSELFDKLYYVGKQEYASIADFRAALLPFADDGMLSVYRIDGLPPEQGWLKPAAKKDEEKI